MGNIEIMPKLSRSKSASSIDHDYLEAAIRGVLRNFVIFTGKHLWWSLFLIKLRACKFIEKRLQHWCFPLHARKFLRTPIQPAAASNYSFSSAIYLFSEVSLQL